MSTIVEISGSENENVEIGVTGSAIDVAVHSSQTDQYVEIIVDEFAAQTAKDAAEAAIQASIGKLDKGGYNVGNAQTLKEEIDDLYEKLDNDYYDKIEIDGKISRVMIYKGSKANYSSLPSTGLEIGHVYNLTDTGHNYVWTGSSWDDLGVAFDVSGKQDALFSGVNIKTVNGSSLLGAGNLNTPDMDTTTAQTVSGLKTFLSGMLALRNAANTFTLTFVNAITAARVVTFQDKNGIVAYTSDLPSYVIPYTFFLDASIGNDSSGLIGDTARPYATLNPILTAIAADPTKDYQINIKKGTYTQTVNSPNANILFYSEALVTLNINANTTNGTCTHIYDMPVSVININYNGTANTGFKRKITCATLSVAGNPNYRMGLLIVKCDNLNLNSGYLFDSNTSGGAKLDLNCQKILSTGTSAVFLSQSDSSFNIVFDSAVASSGSLVINSGSGKGYVRFKSYSSTAFVDAFSVSASANVIYDFYDSLITNGGFNSSQAGYDACIIQGKLKVINNTGGGYMFRGFSQFTFLNAYVVCDTHLIFRSQGLGCFKMVNTYLEISGNYVNNETVSAAFTLPVAYIIGMCEIFQTGTPNAFFNFAAASTGMFLRMRGSLKMNNTGLPAAMTVTNDTTNTY